MAEKDLKKRLERYRELIHQLKPGMTAAERKAWAEEAFAARIASGERDAYATMAIALGEHPGDCFMIGEDGKPVFENPPLLLPDDED